MSDPLQDIAAVAFLRQSPLWRRMGRVLGVLGALAVLAAYALNVNQVMASDGWLVPGMNMIGAGLIVFSLVIEWNLPSFMLEGVWFLVSLVGLFRAFCAPGERAR